MRCPGFERLIDYLDGRLSGTEADRVSAHLAAGCKACSSARDWYVKLNALVKTDDSCDPPQWVLKRAVRLFDIARAQQSGAARAGQKIALLIFDSLTRPAVAGVRSTETANRQLLYRAGDYCIDLQIAPSDAERADLTGQVLREGETAFESVAGISLSLSRRAEHVCSIVTNEMGEFKIEALKQGEYDLSIMTPEGLLCVNDLPIAHS